jgi:transaldolase
MPVATEEPIAWKVVEEISIKGAKLLEPVFRDYRGINGRLSVQTDPLLSRDCRAILVQASHFNTLAPNMIVKIPVTKAGIPAIEEATYQGITINATVCFTLPQCIAVAEAVERGLQRREKEGKDISATGVFKKTYQIFRERGFRLRLLSAAFRNHMHWSEFIGGAVVLSPPHKWQARFNASDIDIVSRMDNPVDARIVERLYAKFPACGELPGLVRDRMIPNPEQQ